MTERPIFPVLERILNQFPPQEETKYALLRDSLSSMAHKTQHMNIAESQPYYDKAHQLLINHLGEPKGVEWKERIMRIFEGGSK